VELEAVATAVRGIPWMSPELGRRAGLGHRATIMQAHNSYGASGALVAAKLRRALRRGGLGRNERQRASDRRGR
jgi:hypothetical protein